MNAEFGHAVLVAFWFLTVVKRDVGDGITLLIQDQSQARTSKPTRW
jgi:hypothetical protein